MKALILLLPIFCLAIDIEASFNAKDYKAVCSIEAQSIVANTSNEGIINMYGIACLKTHMINALALPAAKLRYTPQARQNSAYFADILLKKKLLLHALIDNVDISYVRLAKSDYILSMIFDRYVKGDFNVVNDSLIFEEQNSDTFYEIEIFAENLPPKITLKTYKDNQIISTIEYY
ncbi:hypothetical protein CMCT_0997 [Campylobacter mucosalis]|uniref:hypothetical protein n=1 Tax=Campylobacter mucosalis TaxID=202 RepID=UPI0015935B47|nr:hypothetical protein [Campylobacter mucosalis]QKF63133.1 hypothetical protein CMCT_0997 [Campylobacter mucosalis]